MIEKLTLQQKYKARNPEETINIIKKFFNDKKCVINEKDFKISEIGTYSCYYELIFNNHILYGSSGKGTSELFAKASCYAELYDRFCAFPVYCHNTINFINLQKMIPGNKKAEINELLTNEIAKESLQTIVPSLDKKLLQEYLTAKYGDDFYLYEYQNINKDSSNKSTYFNGILATNYYGTTGLAAGNTLKEALIQGISELYEREVHEKFYTIKQNKYFYLNENILPEYLKNIINNIKKLNYDIKIYDLSYNFKLPVCAIILINKKDHKIFTHFGAFPVIEIAIERCLTEFYQGISKINEKQRKKLITEYDMIPEFLVDSSSSGDYYNEAIIDNIFINSYQLNYYNDSIFISNKEISNNILINQINKINEINNLELYYLNLSLTKDMFAVHIIPNKRFGACILNAVDNVKSYYLLDTKSYINALKASNEILKGLKFITIDKKIPKEEDINNYLNNIIFLICGNTLEEKYAFFNRVCENLKYEYTNPYKVKNDSNIYYNKFFMSYLIGDFEDIEINLDNSFGENIIPWVYFYLYCIKNNQPLEKYNRIISSLGYNPISIRKENFTPALFIKEAIIKNFQLIYNSAEYFDFIKLFIRKEEN